MTPSITHLNVWSECSFRRRDLIIFYANTNSSSFPFTRERRNRTVPCSAPAIAVAVYRARVITREPRYLTRVPHEVVCASKSLMFHAGLDGVVLLQQGAMLIDKQQACLLASVWASEASAPA
jgi:hypothetical protein